MFRVSEKLERQLWSHCDKSGGEDACWLWTGMKDRDGYGRLRATELGIKNMCAHRLVYMVSSGEQISKSLVVAHECDTPSCCNPRHLSAITQAENMRQASERKRFANTGRRLGQQAKTQMAKDYGTLTAYQLADKYDCHYTTVRRSLKRAFKSGAF